MNDQSYFHWDFFRQPLQSPNLNLGTSLIDIREEAMRELQVKTKGFPMDPSCAFWSKEVGLDTGEGMATVGTRVLEMRKEKSRDAARSRRGKENYEFYELAKLLPLPAAITSQLDKASIIRLSISYLKLREFSSHGDPPWNRDGSPPDKTLKGAHRRRNPTAIAMEMFENHQGTHILQAMDGFAFSLANDGRFLYISETVSIYLGLSQVEMAGSSIFDYVHHQDHQELAEQLGIGIGSIPSNMSSPASPTEEGTSTSQRTMTPIPDRAPLMTPSFENGLQRSFCIRMKSTLTKRGVHVRSSGYRVVYIHGNFRLQLTFTMNRKPSTVPVLGMVAVAFALPPPTITEFRLESDTFIMRLSPELRVLYCENVISNLTDWLPEDLCNSVLYNYCHTGDLTRLRKTHTDLLSKGQVLSDYIRLMNKNGGYFWVQMCATSLFHSKTVEEHTVLAIFYVLSGIEYNGCVMDTAQLPKINFSDTDHSDTADHSEQKSDQDKTDKGPHSLQIMNEHKTAPNIQEGHQSSGRDHVEKSDTGDEHGNQSSGGNIKLVDVPVQEHGENELSVSLCGSNTCDDDNDVFHDRAAEDCSLLSLHDISDNFKCDGKNSRRKADKPRKRRRESDHDDNNSAIEGRKIGKNCDISKNESELCGMDLEQKTKSQILVNKENLFASNLHSQPDLSLPGSPNETDNTQSVISLLSPQVPEDLSVKPGICDKQSSSPFHSELLQASPGHSSRNTVPTSMLQTQRTPTSVQELEEVMSKHLPSMKDMDQLSLKPKDNCRNLSSFQKQKSTIQWVGSQTTVHDSLPASTLLRNLYANRESVIRSSSSRPSCYPCSDLTVPSTTTSSMAMLTPPGVEGFKDQMYIPQISLPSKNLSVFSTSPLSVSLPSSLTDSYSMTPPSSVSPQEKGQSPFQDPSFNDPCGVSMGSVVISSSNHNRTSAGKMYSFPPMIASPMDYDQEKSTYLSVPHYHNGAVSTVVDSYNYFPNNVGGSTGILANESKSAGPWYPSPFSS